ncbi:MAG: MaoC family dehydratase N-terminal domain-containing protein [bacterium]
MPLDPAVLEREFPEFEFLVERGKIREYALALGLADPVHTDLEAARAAGYADLLAPPTFTRQFWHETEENDPMRHLGFDPARRLHGEQEFEYHKPLVAGTALRGRTVIVSTREKEGRRGGMMTFVVIETRLVDEAGELVQVARRTLIETAAPPKD